MFVFLFIILQLHGVNHSELLNDARNNFLQISSMEAAENKGDLWLSSEDVTLQAYGSCMYFMQARYAKNPITKWGRFKKGKKKLDQLISENGTNAELRYLRFLFQSEMPEFLGYHENREEDFNFVLKHIDEAPFATELKCLFLENISKVEQLTIDQKNEIHKKLQKCS